MAPKPLLTMGYFLKDSDNKTSQRSLTLFLTESNPTLPFHLLGQSWQRHCLRSPLLVPSLSRHCKLITAQAHVLYLSKTLQAANSGYLELILKMNLCAISQFFVNMSVLPPSLNL